MIRKLAFFTIAASLALATPRSSEACGGFFARKTKTVPSLQVEQALIVFDAAKGQEDFIREITFRDAKEPFGFVVPTPSKPTVAKVDKSPFAELAREFPPEDGLRLGRGGGAVSGAGKGGGLAGVAVLSQQRIGSFTAFVLAATDSGALKAWLDKNQLTTTPESDAWLAHYVALGFYYVAFRYEMPKEGEGATKSETVRISFASALPFYPYREPAHPSTKDDRVLAVWLVSPERYVPVARHGDGWARPWMEGNHFVTKTHDELAPTLGPLLPDGASWTVQAFEDQKRSRGGWGDVVLVPEKAREADLTKLAPLAASLKADQP